MGLLDGILGIAGLATDIFSADSARSGQAEANRTNLQVAREQMGFQERMSNTSYQRAVADLRAAGLNPMMALMKGGASTPPGASARVESDTADSSAIMSNAVPKLLATRMNSAAVANAEATARKTNAEAAIIEKQIPFSGANAQAQADMLQEGLRKIGAEISNLNLDAVLKEQQKEIGENTITLSDLDVQTQEKLKPLLLQYQELLNQAEKLGMPEREATAKFWSQIPEGKFMSLIKDLLVLTRGGK